MLTLVHNSSKLYPLQPVLVVENDPTNQASLKAYLQNHLALDVHIAANASTASGLLSASAHHMPYQLILISGLQDAPSLTTRGPHIARRIIDMPIYKRVPVYGASADPSSWASVIGHRKFTYLDMILDPVTETLRWDIPALASHFTRRAA